MKIKTSNSLFNDIIYLNWITKLLIFPRICTKDICFSKKFLSEIVWRINRYFVAKAEKIIIECIIYRLFNLQRYIVS